MCARNGVQSCRRPGCRCLTLPCPPSASHDAKQAHPECGFDQDSRRRGMLAAVLLPIADLQVPVSKGKPVRCAPYLLPAQRACGCWQCACWDAWCWPAIPQRCCCSFHLVLLLAVWASFHLHLQKSLRNPPWPAPPFACLQRCLPRGAGVAQVEGQGVGPLLHDVCSPMLALACGVGCCRCCCPAAAAVQPFVLAPPSCLHAPSCAQPRVLPCCLSLAGCGGSGRAARHRP